MRQNREFVSRRKEIFLALHSTRTGDDRLRAAWSHPRPGLLTRLAMSASHYNGSGVRNSADRKALGGARPSPQPSPRGEGARCAGARPSPQPSPPGEGARCAGARPSTRPSPPGEGASSSPRGSFYRSHLPRDRVPAMQRGSGRHLVVPSRSITGCEKAGGNCAQPVQRFLWSRRLS
jgi:hypothetical protein